MPHSQRKNRTTLAQVALGQFLQEFLAITEAIAGISAIRGLSNLSRMKGGVIVSNHPTALDHLIISTAVRLIHDKKVYFLSKQRLHEKFWQSILWHETMGSVALGGERISRRAYLRCREILSAGNFLCIYPEGNHSSTSYPDQFFPGAFSLAKLSGVQVLPVALRYESVKATIVKSRQLAIVSFLEAMDIDNPALASISARQMIEASIRLRLVQESDLADARVALDDLSLVVNLCERVGDRLRVVRHRSLLRIIYRKMARLLTDSAN